MILENVVTESAIRDILAKRDDLAGAGAASN